MNYKLFIIGVIACIACIGVVSASSCYQESVNVSNQSGMDGNGICNLQYTGTTGFEGLNTTWSYGASVDGDWSTQSDIGLSKFLPVGTYYGRLSLNYTKPNSTIPLYPIWQIKYDGYVGSLTPGNITRNITIPLSCLYTTQLQLSINLSYYTGICVGGCNTHMALSCYNGTSWQSLSSPYESIHGGIFEEALYWNSPVYSSLVLNAPANGEHLSMGPQTISYSATANNGTGGLITFYNGTYITTGYNRGYVSRNILVNNWTIPPFVESQDFVIGSMEGMLNDTSNFFVNALWNHFSGVYIDVIKEINTTNVQGKLVVPVTPGAAGIGVCAYNNWSSHSECGVAATRFNKLVSAGYIECFNYTSSSWTQLWNYTTSNCTSTDGSISRTVGEPPATLDVPLSCYSANKSAQIRVRTTPGVYTGTTSCTTSGDLQEIKSIRIIGNYTNSTLATPLCSVNSTDNAVSTCTKLDTNIFEHTVSWFGIVATPYANTFSSTNTYDVEGLCQENWTQNAPTSCSGISSHYTITYTDQKNCNTTYTLPANNGTVVDCGLFISIWDTTKTSIGSSASNQVHLPLVFTGTYNFNVNWGDGTNNTITVWNDVNTTHTYATSGLHTIYISGIINGFRFNNAGDRLKLVNVNSWSPLTLGNAPLTSGSYFYGCANLNIQSWDSLNLTGITSFSNMFRDAITFNGNISNWNTGSVTDMSNAFNNAPAFNGDISTWNVASVTNFESMFEGASLFNQNVGTWNVVSATNMKNMFKGAAAFTQLVRTTKWQDLSTVDSGNWIDTDNILSLKYATNNRLIYAGIGAGKFGAYDSTTNIFNDLSSKDSRDWVGISDVNSITYTNQTNNGTIYTAINNGKLGRYYFTSTLYQESANVSNQGGIDSACGLNYDGVYAITTDNSTGLGSVYINYTQPSVPLLSAKWQVKHGILPTYNVTIPNDCLLNPVQLRFDSRLYVDGYSEGFCYNSTTWKNITQLSQATNFFYALVSLVDHPDNLIDGNWSSEATARLYLGNMTWLTCDTSYGNANDCMYSRIFEEAMIWNLNGSCDGWQDLSSTDTGDWAAGSSLYSIVSPLDTAKIYTGASAGKLGVYDPTTNIWTDLSGTDTGNWVGSRYVTALYSAYDPQWNTNPLRNLTYTAIRSGNPSADYTLGVYNSSNNVWAPLGAPTRSLFSIGGEAHTWAIPYPSGSFSLYGFLFLGYDGGQFGAWNLQTNTYIDLSTTDPSNWAGTDTITSIRYNDADSLVYTGLTNGKFGAYNALTNIWTDLSSTDSGWVSSSTINTLSYNPNTGLIYTGLDSGKFGAYNPSPSWNTISVQNMSGMFQNAVSFNQELLFDTRNVVNMNDMFNNASSFNGALTGDTQNYWRLSNLLNMSGMFKDAILFNQDISGWSYLGGVTDMSYVFDNARAFNQNLTTWDTTSVINMDHMFNNATLFAGNINNWNTASVTNMAYMFNNVPNFNSDISLWNTGNVNYMQYMFDNNVIFNQNISSWNTENVVNMDYMFNDAITFNQPIGNWSTGRVTSMDHMFNKDNVNIWSIRSNNTNANWRQTAISADGSIQAAVAYGGAQGIYVSTSRSVPLVQQTAPNANWYSIAMSSNGQIQIAGQDVGYIFQSTDYGTTWIQKTSDAPRSWYGLAMSSNGQIQTGVVNNGYIYVSIDSGNTWIQKTNTTQQWWGIAMSADGIYQTASAGTGLIFASNDSGNTWVQSNAPSANWFSVAMSANGQYQTATQYSGYIYSSNDYGITWIQRTSDSIRNWYSVAISADGHKQSAVARLNQIYESLDYGITWNQKSTGAAKAWRTASMSSDGLFQIFGTNIIAGDYIYGLSDEPSTFNQPIGNWDTSRVTNMDHMFNNNKVFNQDISGWDTGRVTTMAYMFNNNPVFNYNVGNWDMTNVLTTAFMFTNNPVFNQPIGTWNTESNENMSSMLANATSFNQNIGAWPIDNARDMSNMFAGVSLDQHNGVFLDTSTYDNILIGWAANTPYYVTFDAGNSHFSCDSLNARNHLVNNYGWTIIDAGTSCAITGRTNVAGWDYLMQGNVGMAAFTALNTPVQGWLIMIFWIVITLIIITRTNSWELSTIVGLIFLALFLVAPWFSGAQIAGAILFMVFQLGVVLFRIAAKEKSI